MYHRPDLTPELVDPSEVPEDISTRDCGLWAVAGLEKRGKSYLRTLPQVARCVDVPLVRPAARMASELLSCGS